MVETKSDSRSSGDSLMFGELNALYTKTARQILHIALYVPPLESREAIMLYIAQLRKSSAPAQYKLTLLKRVKLIVQ